MVLFYSSKLALTAAIVLALTFTLGCEEKSSNKPAAEAAKSSTFTDSRDSKAYKWVKIGTQTWMAENLNYEIAGSRCYNDEPLNCQKYGRLYTFETAKSACPSGWHLPSNAEWQALIDSAGGEEKAGKILKSSSGWDDDKSDRDKVPGNGTDDFGFSALPGGYTISKGTSFRSIGNVGFWWSDFEFNSFKASRQMISNYKHRMSRIIEDKVEFYSVRCVQDSPDGKITDSRDGSYKKASVDVLSWPQMPADKFGCMMEKTFGYKDKRFNCSLKGYENKGDPCKNTTEYYEGPEFPDSLVKKVHPWLSNINLSWEHGDLQYIDFSFDSAITEKQVLGSFGLSSLKSSRDNILGIDTQNGGLQLTGFEHMGAGEVNCDEEGDEEGGGDY